jgi:preprotein translocase subunit SecF
MNLQRTLAAYRGEIVPEMHLIQRRRLWFAISGSLVVIAVLALLFGNLEFSIDFRGGAQITYPTTEEVQAAEIEAVLAEHGIDDAEIQIVNEDTVTIRTESIATEGRDADALLGSLAEQAGVDRDELSVEDVGPTWGGEISRKALQGLLIVIVLVFVYITWRFEWAMGAAAIVALLHDVIVTAGIYALVGRPVAPETVIAILTIMGFSLYDTVVIFDKVQENLESPALLPRYGYDGVVNLALNSVFMRSVNTSLVLLPIASMLVFGGETLKDFAFAMLIGTLVGTYSSIFVAAPVLTVIKGRTEQVRTIEERRRIREAKGAVPSAAAETVGAAPAGATSAASATSTGAAPKPGRPRPTSKRRPPAKRKRR